MHLSISKTFNNKEKKMANRLKESLANLRLIDLKNGIVLQNVELHASQESKIDTIVADFAHNNSRKLWCDGLSLHLRSEADEWDLYSVQSNNLPGIDLYFLYNSKTKEGKIGLW